MKITTFWMADNFAKFNKEYFNDELPTPHFEITNSRKELGKCMRRGLGSSTRYTIKESIFYERPMHDFEQTLLHEMIHLYFFKNRHLGERGHGYQWQRMAKSFDKYGYHIRTTSNVSIVKDNNSVRRKILTFTEKASGKIWVCWISETKPTNFFLGKLSERYYINPQLWFTTSDKASMLKQCYKVLGGRCVTQNQFDEEWASLLIPC